MENRLGLFVGVARGQGPRLDAHGLQRANLVAHQRDQRGYHHRHPVTTQGRKLKTQRFSPARRHDGQRVAAGKHRLDDLGLARAKIGKPEDRLQKPRRVVQGQTKALALLMMTIRSAKTAISTTSGARSSPPRLGSTCRTRA